MPNNNPIETAILVLNDVLSDVSMLSTENGDIFSDEVDEINNQIAIMQQNLAHKDHQVIDEGCTVCGYAGHDDMQERLL